MNTRRLNNSQQMNNEYRIEFNSSNPIQDELQTNPIEQPPSPSPSSSQQQQQPIGPTTATNNANNEINNDHFHQIVHFLKDNLTSTFPFALILILKAFYEHSAGIFMVIFFSASIYHANTVLVQQTALKVTTIQLYFCLMKNQICSRLVNCFQLFVLF